LEALGFSNPERSVNCCTYFRFSEPPFQDIPDQRFLYLSKKHEEVLAELIDFITSRRGIALVTGEIGIGKTMLISALVQRLPQNFRPILLDRPSDEPMALIMGITSEIGINIKEGSLLDLNLFTDTLKAAAQEGKFSVVLLDNAHLLTDRHLGEVCFFSQMEFPSQGQHLLPIVLVGRREMDEKIDGQANNCLRQLIEARINLPGLSPEETILYIDHHLKQAGSSFASCFAEDCSSQLFSITRGVPRLINQMCVQALERCWPENLPRVTPAILAGGRPTPRQESQDAPPQKSLRKKIGIMTAAALLIVLAGYAIYQDFADKIPILRTASKVAPTATLPGAPPDQALSASPMAGSTSAGGQASSGAPSQPAPIVVDLGATRPQNPSQRLDRAEVSSGSPADIQTVQAEKSASATYRVTPDKNLYSIVAKHYPFNRKSGFAAIILANPEITSENLIFPGQNLYLPKMDNTGVIILKDNRYYFLYKRYEDVSKVNKTVSNLKERQCRFLVRETENPDVGEVYRIFLGGYEKEEDLKAAVKMAEME
jgi:type II secretory pathway predicted ATPase ExeA